MAAHDVLEQMRSAHRGVLIVDFGTQYCQLIARRIRELSVFSEICTPEQALKALGSGRYGALILSGGPRSVYERDAPRLDPSVLDYGLPMLGICYGMQWTAHTLGGEVVAAHDAAGREYGSATFSHDGGADHPLLKNVPATSQVWMSHGDEVRALPEGFEKVGQTQSCAFAAAWNPDRRIALLQFHPEVTHSIHGDKVLQNFVFGVAGLTADWNSGSIEDDTIAALREQIGDDGEVVLGLSGGVDSSVAAMLIHKAIGDRLHCVFVDNGLLRHGEREGVEALFGRNFHMNLEVVDASEQFLADLAGVSDPETKRKRIGHRFVEVFREAAKKHQRAHFLGQGTLYPDVIESVAAHGGATSTIKSHHNVGG
ncbi:MAG: glutamine-hydrolyzing GMP synthase, partial [Planctomycetes bacterium]|nr:glutamine-hydrolyzing GMP synthase [Planctomycetota bacterium]